MTKDTDDSRDIHYHILPGPKVTTAKPDQLFTPAPRGRKAAPLFVGTECSNLSGCPTLLNTIGAGADTGKACPYRSPGDAVRRQIEYAAGTDHTGLSARPFPDPGHSKRVAKSAAGKQHSSEAPLSDKDLSGDLYGKEAYNQRDVSFRRGVLDHPMERFPVHA